MRTIVQGLGPGFTTVATRRSVIFRLDGLELVFTLRNCGSGPASAFVPTNAPPNITADVFKTPRRSIVVSVWLNIVSSPHCFHICLLTFAFCHLTCSFEPTEQVKGQNA